MTRAVYLLGGAGSGKSTLTSRLFAGAEFAPLQDLHTKPNARGSLITLRGHEATFPAGERVLYLGVWRDQFPGTDGLDRVSTVPGKEWLERGNLPERLFAEGNTLSARPFMYALAEATDLLVIHLWCRPEEVERRVAGRGHEMNMKWVEGTATRAENVAKDLEDRADVWFIRSDVPGEVDLAFEVARNHLLPGDFVNR